VTGAELLDPQRPRLVRPVSWRWSDDPERGRIVEALHERTGEWVAQRAWSGIVLEALDAGGEEYDVLVRRVLERHPEYKESQARLAVRRYLYGLWVEGNVSLEFPPPPKTFADRYQVVRELGRGGVGVAWLCKDAQTGDDVVVKHAWNYFHPTSVTDEFMRKEADVMRRLDHPGIVRLAETFEEGGLLHLVREFADGAPIRSLARDGVPGVAMRIAAILEHLHARGYLILDLRPANFLRGPDGRVMLIDVGLCRALDDGEVRLPGAMGTPGFISPEVVDTRTATVRTDVFGFGRLLFTLLAGTLPRGGWGPDELAARLGEDPYRDLVLRLCASDPAMRPGDMTEVRRLLAEV
jgi:serine/threonine protein kinase